MPRVIRVHVQTAASFENIEELDIDEYKIWTTAIPEKGGANESIIEMLADYFDTAPSNIRIISGNKSKHKLIEIK